ncbi:MAG: hypothetical protein GY861_16030 [bacterium]|nr:hypothetical protein [bacterium]
MNNIESAVRKINGATFATVDYSTPNHSLLKTSKVDGSINPFWADKADIRKVVTNSLINLGVKYEQAVNGRITKKGDVDADFTAKPMNGKVEHTDSHKLLCQDAKTGTKTYIRYMPMSTKNMEVKYVLNGKDITSAIDLYKPVKKEASRQADKGLDRSEQVMWRTLDIANVTTIRILGTEIQG